LVVKAFKAIRNNTRKVITGQTCCGHPGEPGCWMGKPDPGRGHRHPHPHWRVDGRHSFPSRGSRRVRSRAARRPSRADVDVPSTPTFVNPHHPLARTTGGSQLVVGW